MTKRPSANGARSPASRSLLPLIKSKRGGKRTKVPPRYKPPKRYVQEIRQLQTTTDLLVPAASFARLVREITMQVTNNACDIRWQGLALRALHEAAEHYIIGLFEDSYLCTLHSKRITLMAKDLHLAHKIRGDVGRYY